MAHPSAAPAGESTPSRQSCEEKLVAALISLMEAGGTPWRRPWDASGGHHVNLLSGRRYRGGNPALLSFGMHLRGSSLPYWCGFAEARALGLAPRRGSKAVHVVRPQVLERRNTSTEAAAESLPERERQGSEAGEPSGGSRRVLYRPVPVFNAADLEGDTLQDLIRARRAEATTALRPEPERLHGAEAILGAWTVPVIHGGDQAFYQVDGDRIHLPDRAAFHSGSAHVATWAHEAIHSTGHRSRLDRDLSGVMGAPDASGRAYAREELIAELGAVLLGDRLEIGSDTQNHAAYLSHWIALLRESPRLLLLLLSEARRAADLICPEPHPDADGTRPARSLAAQKRSDSGASQA